MTSPLPPQYYLTNFRYLIAWVSERYADLLSPEEQLFISRFAELGEDSQCLLVRMLGRKGPWFRADKLNYVEIDKIENCAEQLLAANLIQVDSLLNIEELANLLTKPELLSLFKADLLFHKNARKETLLATLNTAYPLRQTWSQWTGLQWGQLYHVDSHNLISTFLLLFFGNPYQNLTEFVLQDLGLYRYEQYAIDQQHRIFKSREEVAQYQQILLLREQLTIAEDLTALEDIVLQLPNAFANPAMERRRARFINQLAYEFERFSAPEIALQLYQLIDLPPARERQIRLREKRGDYQNAWQLLTALISNPANEHELQIAERMAPRLAKKVGEQFNKKINHTIKEINLVLLQLAADTGDFLKVEETARIHFNKDSAPCFYVENILLTSLLGLWLWPEMFRGIDGAFANPLQSAPLDLYREEFQKNRPELHKLWQLFHDQSHTLHIQNIWQQKHGIANHLVHWQAIDENILQIALHCIPAQHLKLIFQRLLFDLKTNRSGLPDLIQFFPEKNSYRMIEIKGPGDRLQDNQRRWLDFFSLHEIPAEVCYVNWQ